MKYIDKKGAEHGDWNAFSAEWSRESRTYAGQFVKKYYLDELPQFYNVLKGDMSIVGPRPHMIAEDDILAEELTQYSIRHWVRPGITGLAAIKGFMVVENINQKKTSWYNIKLKDKNNNSLYSKNIKLSEKSLSNIRGYL